MRPLKELAAMWLEKHAAMRLKEVTQFCWKSMQPYGLKGIA